MRMDDYYRNVAKISLNASIAALLPAILIVIGNLTFFHHQQVMMFTIPFLIYSIVCYQSYLMKMKKAIMIGKNLMKKTIPYHSLFEADKLLVLFINTFSPKLLIFFPDGYLAAVIKKYRKRERIASEYKKTFGLYDHDEKLISSYIMKGKQSMMIEVYDKNSSYVGCFERKQLRRMKKAKKELLDAEGRFIGAVEGAAAYLDEQIMDPHDRLIVRLRRGWLPLEWSSSFPDPNTPVLSLSNRLTVEERILQMSFLINEFFFER